MNTKIFQDMIKLLEWAYLEDSRDSYHANPIPFEMIKQAIELYSAIYLKLHLLPIHIAPFSGGIQLEYRENSNALEVEIRGINKYAYLFIQGEKENDLTDNRTFSEEDNVNQTRIFEMLEQVLSQQK